jgi:di/tricarboxylate transporter
MRMTLEAWIAVAVVAMVIGLLAFTRFAADVVLVAGVTLLLVSGVLTPREALAGLSNEGMATVAVLYIVAAGLRETGAVAWLVQRVLGQPRNLFHAQLRIMAPAAAASGFLNNTPIVAMFLPAVVDWARQNRLPVSKLLIPLSYAAILGGTCTLIGTSTNLVVNGLLISRTSLPGLEMFDIAWVGVPATLAGIAYLVLLGRWLLPDRRPVMDPHDDPRRYTIEMLVQPSSPLVGRSVEEAGLRHLPGMYLVEIERDGDVYPAIAPHHRLKASDRLVFAGILDSVVDLQRFRGLVPATDQVFKLGVPRPERSLVEAVVSDSGPLVGKSIRESRFRNVYNAAVIAVARNGERVHKKIGDIVLRPGDTLLLEADPSFVERQRNSRDFFLVSRLENAHPLRHEQALTALVILAGMVAAVSFGRASMLQGALVAAGLMLVTRCITGGMARTAVDWQVLIAIAASFGLGYALEKTGAAQFIAQNLIELAQGSPWGALTVVYLVTMLFTELITNNAAAVLVFPIALSTSESLGVSFMPFAIAIMMAASASFSTPIGYQCNLMVYGPGGYRFSDFFRVGIPLNLLIAAVTLAIVPMVWRF